MNRARSLGEIARIRASIERVGKLSDSVVRFGPFGIGLDGVLAWVPGIPAGAIYSILAGLFLVFQGYRARVAYPTLGLALGLLAVRTTVTAAGETVLPLLFVEFAVDLFRAHKWTADLMLKAIDQTHYVETAGQGAGVAPSARPQGKRRTVALI